MDYINDDVELTKDKSELTLELLMPYDTEEECKTRIVEMIEDSIDVFRMIQVPMIFKLTSCVHPDDMEFTNVNTTDQYSKR